MKQKIITPWYTLAAEQGYSGAKYNLGLMYYKGDGVSQDYKETIKWYTQAAEQGYAAAQSNLGLMYAVGQGVLQDTIMAHMWANIGFANGNENGGKARDMVAKKMTTADVSKAQAMARDCMSSDYKNCGY